MQKRQAIRPVPLTKAEDTLIVVNRGGLKRGVGFALDLHGRTDARNGSNDQVGRQAKAAAHFCVAGVLNLHLVARRNLACHVGNEVAGVGKGDKRRVEFSALLWGWRKFAGKRPYGVHRECYITYESYISNFKCG